MRIRGIVLVAAIVASGVGPARAQVGTEPPVTVIATFERVPTGEQLDALRAYGLRVQGFTRLPMAVVHGPATALDAAATAGIARAFYPDEVMPVASTASNRAVRADAMHAHGFTGEGMQIAVVDTGIDATHPDLARRVTHNYKVVGPESSAAWSHVAAPVVGVQDLGPRSNTDLGSGHGTLVAGVIAADGTSAPSNLGVAPEAEVIGYSTGTSIGLVQSRILAAYDHILANPSLSVDVVNNSFGSSVFIPFDPARPMHLATRALADAGKVVVFAAGNTGHDDREMSISPHAVAPWVIGAAATTQNQMRAVYSSNGLQVDNSFVQPLVDGHVSSEGDRLGLHHPTIAAQGNVTSSCTTGGEAYSGGEPCVPGGVTGAQGTSLASPAISGLAALLVQARPSLTPIQVRRVLEATARPTTDAAPFWQVGYGIADGAAALDLVLSPSFESRLDEAHAEATRAIMMARDWTVQRSDLWTWPLMDRAIPGLSERRTLTFDVADDADAVRVTIGREHPDLSTVSRATHLLTIRDQGSEQVATLTLTSEKVASVLIDRRTQQTTPGRWTITVLSSGGLSTWGDLYAATVQAASLRAQVPTESTRGRFVAEGTTTLYFTPDVARASGARSRQGCELEQGEPLGALSPAPPSGACHAGLAGYTLNELERPATFTSAPLDRDVIIGGRAHVVTYIADEARKGTLPFWLDLGVASVAPDGTETPLGYEWGEDAFSQSDPRIERTFTLPAEHVPAGHRLRVRIFYLNQLVLTPGLMLFGGETYSDAGVTLTYGRIS